MKTVKVILVISAALICCETSTLKKFEYVKNYQSHTDSAEHSSTEKVDTEDANTEGYFAESNEILKSGETPEASIKNGNYFLLRLTIDEKWNEDFCNRSSDVFKTLAKNLGSELIDLVDNSVEATEINTTNFILIEVLPSRDSKLYVSFVMTSKTEIDGEVLYNALTNKININHEIYTYKATIDGFVLRNISKEEGDILAEEFVKEICDPTGKNAI